MTEAEKEKRRFRQRKEWKDFREEQRKKQKRDYLTGKPLTKTYELHHLDLNPDNYQDLNPEHFITLNSKSHSSIHFLYSYYVKDPMIIDRLKEILDRMLLINNS